MSSTLERVNDLALGGFVKVTSTDVSALRERKMAWVWVFFAILIMVAAAVAFVMCLNRGYRGFSGNWRFHTKWKIPVGIDLGCY
ncbi:hypothetical protein [Nocardioides sp.]|uniref:hypothetical protein n=1 Tax=Nocardioides sp. TaxID=35761 RepID=UPI003D0A74C9